MADQKETKELVIFNNDGIDSDNVAAWMVQSQLSNGQSGVELVLVFESRPVNFSLVTLRPDDQARLDSLLKNNFGHIGTPLKIRLNGLLTVDDLDKGFSKEDQSLLRMAINHSKGSREDSELHASLMARDLAMCLSELSGSSRRGNKVTILVDRDAISDTSPVNLKCHAQEELFNRSPKAIRGLRKLMELPEEEDRRQAIRKWYEKQIKKVNKKLRGSNISVHDLDLRRLKDKIRNAENVTFIAGASFKLLRLLADDKGVAAKIDCVAQAGTLDLGDNIFKNQFNIALDRESACYVLDNPQLFRSFAAVPTHTSKQISFSLGGLERRRFSSLAKWILCFNHHQDPLDVAKRKVTLAGQYSEVTIKLPDLAMILLRSNSEVYPRLESKYMVETVEGESLLFVKSNDGRGITAWLPEVDHEYGTVDLVDLLTLRTIDHSKSLLKRWARVSLSISHLGCLGGGSCTSTS
ncbi:hypothetical protein FGLOB1_11374 [Fusarium globosum]|uniref:Uncharacterized protein n=1 Tax=Fusarium globosum TaxID=78864 RepID=A0A8H5XSN2_9HYPO|nr:hypothetical protein FGLOB1_11374 [Fusarium globosum]